MANPITGSRYDEAATNAILKRRFGTSQPLETRVMPLVGGVGGAIAQGAGNIASGVKYYATGQDSTPAPAVRPATSTPSAYMKGLIESVGNFSIPKAPAPLNAKYVAGPTNVNAGGSPAPVPAPRGVVNGEQVRGIPFRNSTMSEVELAKQRYADWQKNADANATAMRAKWNTPQVVGSRPNKDVARDNMNDKMRAEQTAQANVAGDREADVEKFKASEAARGAIGANETKYNQAIDAQALKNKGLEEAARVKGDQNKAKNDIEILKALAQSEDDATKNYALAQLKKLGGIPEGQTNPQDAQAIEWAKKNPQDPRSAAILAKNGVKA
jgi:hypothetical protein